MTTPDPILPIDQGVLVRLNADLAIAKEQLSTRVTVATLDLHALLADHARLSKAYAWFSESGQLRKDRVK